MCRIFTRRHSAEMAVAAGRKIPRCRSLHRGTLKNAPNGKIRHTLLSLPQLHGNQETGTIGVGCIQGYIAPHQLGEVTRNGQPDAYTLR